MINRVIIDLEATCADERNPEFDRDKSEIIEIGAVLINEDAEVLSRFQVFVKPALSGQLTEFCKELTHISQHDVDSAPDFASAQQQLDDWFKACATEHGIITQWGSWGGYDKRQFLRNCALLGVPAGAFLDLPHENYKDSYARRVRNSTSRKKQAGVGLALKLQGMSFEGTQHRALDDAINIARLVKLIPKA